MFKLSSSLASLFFFFCFFSLSLFLSFLAIPDYISRQLAQLLYLRTDNTYIYIYIYSYSIFSSLFDPSRQISYLPPYLRPC
ncbi:hypothetical protein BO86DRAFT_48943 [Aspergillus japonicus CBS 114.51]|uniref:Uncharacterized protein n=1 Tax=Aspergillus japonicus CBS 114.51 TaxID=1448312 RepID=A0A8T8X5F8_ASPJA|nr:hypothetical protein BO86DRAFT_48943 [Aspergillus japonicus CBS 114.51]RAH83383.1 hypothetical protein BO86DRAFT_48943 [Aspergillus japonicus CBS 114.51]